MPRRTVRRDEESLFLLPFEEVASCILADPLPKDTSDPDVDAADGQTQPFNSCLLSRTSSKLLANGNVRENHDGQFRLLKQQFVLLRPEENSLRPGVGRVVDIFKRGGVSAVRIQWFYRAEDLSESPLDAIGEDEVFETLHYDDVDVDSIAGRCHVSSYKEWVTALVAEREKNTAHGGLRSGAFGRLHNSASGICKECVEEAEEKGEEGDDSGMNTGNEEEDDSVVEVPVENGNVNGQCIGNPVLDDDDDVMSSFRENYPDAAVTYYCRRFYDPLMHVFLVSKFEDENADPAEEIMARRGVGGDHGDDEFEMDVTTDSSSDTGDSAIESAEEDGALSPSSRKRPRGKRRKHAVRKRDRSLGAAQFSLPQDSGVPPKLPCRDSQKQHVRKFLLGAIKESASEGQGGSRCLYISGVPGTGKTATVREVLRDLRALRAKGNLPPFEVVEVNAMSLPDPNLVYSELYTAVTGSRSVAPMHAAQLLEKRFMDMSNTSSKRSSKRMRGGPTAREMGSCTILVLDEMDVLLARKQKVLYDVLEWPTRKNARMAVIGIANTMDLPERMLPRLGSRLGLNRLSYPPYTSDQLRVILEATLDQSEVGFSDTALKLCAAKVGAVSGDVRRALELCRRASELVLENAPKPKRRGKKKAGSKTVVKPEHINEAIQDVAGGARLVALTYLSLFERLSLTSALSVARSQGSFAVESMCSLAAVTTHAIESANTHKAFFAKSGVPTTEELYDAVSRLAAQRVVLVERAAVYSKSRVVLNVSADDCLFALRECELSMKLLSKQ